VQDPKNTCKIGDKVLITKIQPVSKWKYFIILKNLTVNDKKLK
jgi:ribosomal protein S17